MSNHYDPTDPHAVAALYACAEDGEQAKQAAPTPFVLSCDGANGCAGDVTHIDTAGFAYCAKHGAWRQQYEPCRKLRAHELARLKRGLPLTKY